MKSKEVELLIARAMPARPRARVHGLYGHIIAHCPRLAKRLDADEALNDKFKATIGVGLEASRKWREAGKRNPLDQFLREVGSEFAAAFTGAVKANARVQG